MSGRQWGLFSDLMVQSVCSASQLEPKAGILVAQGLAATLTPITKGHLGGLLCADVQLCARTTPQTLPWLCPQRTLAHPGSALEEACRLFWTSVPSMQLGSNRMHFTLEFILL